MRTVRRPRTAGPPRFASWLLRRVLPDDARGASILGDLIEEFHVEAARRSRAVAARRYWRHALSVGARYLWMRARRRRRPAPMMVDVPVSRRAPMGFGLLREDVRYAARALVRTPGFTLIALATLALGIGASTAIFSIVYTVLLRPLPFPDPNRLVFVAESQLPAKDAQGVSWPNFRDWQARAASFDDLACSLSDAVNVTGDQPRRLDARDVTWNFFRALGVRPVAGRLFDENDARAGAADTIVISHELWMRDFDGQASALGQTLTFDRQPYTIIGVLPAGFRFMTPADVYIPLEPRVAAGYRGLTDRRSRTNLYALARLKPSVSPEQAGAEMDAIASTLTREYPDANTRRGIYLSRLSDRMVERFKPTLIVLAGAVAFLLIIACVNLASLLLTRGASRTHELAIRAALGCSRWRLIRQLLVEQGLLVLAGSILGALAGAGLLKLLMMLAPRDVPRLHEVRLDDLVLLWTTLASSACAFAFGLVPALKASSVRGQELLVRAGRAPRLSTSRLRRGLMIAEIAVATVLLAGSGLMVRTVLHLTQFDPGFDPHNLLVFWYQLNGDAWPRARQQAFYDAVIDRVRAIPGVENAGLTLSLPIDGSVWNTGFTPEGRPAPRPGNTLVPAFTPVSSSYFDTMRMRLLRGRAFGRSDTADSLPVAVVNETLARNVWPGEDPVGKRFQGGNRQNIWITIIGVVGDIKMEGVDRETAMQVFLPIVQEPYRRAVAVVRLANPEQSAAAVVAAFREFDKSMPVYKVQTMEHVMSDAIGRQRVSMVVLSVFGAVALLLAMIGLYGVITYGVAERTQEIGVRMALGATGTNVVSLFLRQGLLAAGCGIAVGIAVAFGLTRWLQTLLFGVTTTDSLTFAGVVALLFLVALAACYLPARRAARVDPLVALRWE